jgi:hypothetical protein
MIECKYELNKLIPGLSYEQYAEVGFVRASTLHRMRRSPAHYQAELAHPAPKTEALEFGKLFHFAVENPERFLDTYVLEPEFVGKTKDGKDSTRSAEAKAKREAWYSDQKPGTTIVKRDWADPLVGMLKSCMRHKLVGNLLRNGLREVSCFVEDPETGEGLQFRPDFVSELGYMIDFKTTRNANPNSPFFRNQIFSTRYDEDPMYMLAAAHYTHGAKVARLTGLRSDSMTLIAIEKEYPYGIGIYPLDIGCIGPGEQWRQHLTALYRTCRQTGRWPCYPEKAASVVPPTWVELPE